MNRTFYIFGLRDTSACQKAILVLLSAHRARAPCSMAVASLVRLTGYSRRSVQRALSGLVAGKFIVRKLRRGYTSHYRLSAKLAKKLKGDKCS